MATKTPKLIDDEETIEAPEACYSIKADKLVALMQECGITKRSTYLKLFNLLQPYEDWSVLNKPRKPAVETNVHAHTAKVPFDEKIVRALFFIPSLDKYKYIRLRLAPSAIKAAGTGVYAMDPIPEGAKGVYKGVSRREQHANLYYAWTVKSFDPETGETDDDDIPQYYVDAFDLKTSNWTRFVNCGMTKADNNMDTDQVFDKFFYVATRDIEAGEELFIDYGPDYRKCNLGLKGKY